MKQDEFELDAQMFSATPGGLELLTYLARCALSSTQVGLVTHKHATHRLPGSLGLAPAWRDRAMTQSEQRWVSACIGAHINHFGVSIPISVRGSHPALDTLTPEEIDQFTLHEGGFFGNLFRRDIGLFACASGEPLNEFPVGEFRVCTQPIGDGEATRCGFRYVGQCADASAPVSTPLGDFEEVISVYLDPGYRH
jgi:hypothetical protein